MSPPQPPPPEIDRISALPDEMLIHILSFLPTKSAFTTSILSKRWTSLCNSLTALNFDDEGAEDQDAISRFNRMVEGALSSPHPLQTFCLTSRAKRCRRYKVDFWVEAAKRRGVENLHLTAYCAILWPRFFTSQTLLVLKLSGGFHLYVSKFESVDLPSLKTLHLLEDTCIGERESFKKLVSGCPNLVDLYAPRVRFSDDTYIHTTEFKTLHKLEKACFNALDVPFTIVYNVKFLRVKRMDKYIVSCYRGMPVFRNLIRIELCFYILDGWDVVVEVLSHCPKLQTLVIEKRAQSDKEKWAYTEPVPECVSLHLRTCSIRNCVYHDLEFAAYIMQNARLLQVLTLYNPVLYMPIVPSFKLLSLKSVLNLTKRNGHIQNLFQNVFHYISEHALFETVCIMILNLQHI